MRRRPTRSTRTDTLFPYTTLFRSEEMAAFYEAHNSSLLSHCADGRISLRRPVNLASPYASSQTVDVEGRLRLGVAQLLVDEEQPRSEEHTSELQSLMRISYAAYRLKKKTPTDNKHPKNTNRT